MASGIDNKFCPICQKVWAAHINFEIAEHLLQTVVEMERRLNERISSIRNNKTNF